MILNYQFEEIVKLQNNKILFLSQYRNNLVTTSYIWKSAD
jgi:hypothetical protein